MFDRLRGLLSSNVSSGRAAPSEQLSTAFLLLELARADFEIAEVERAQVGALLAQAYALEPAAVQALMQDAEAQLADAVSLFDYLKVLNARLDAPGKRRLIEMLWQVAYADGRIDKYEEQLLRKLADLLYIEDKDYIRAKLSVAEAADRSRG